MDGRRLHCDACSERVRVGWGGAPWICVACPGFNTDATVAVAATVAATVAAAAAVRVRKFKLKMFRVSAGISLGKAFGSGSACSTLDQKVTGGTSYLLVQSPHPQLYPRRGYSPNQKTHNSAKLGFFNVSGNDFGMGVWAPQSGLGVLYPRTVLGFTTI